MFFTQKPNIWKYFKNPTYIWKYFKMLVSYDSDVENNLPNNLLLKPTYFSQGSCESDSIDWVSIELKFPVNLALFVGSSIRLSSVLTVFVNAFQSGSLFFYFFAWSWSETFEEKK